MNNYEKYADEIRKYACTDFCETFTKPRVLKSNTCKDVDTDKYIDCQACHMLQMIWLLEEYEEPKVDWSKVEVDTPILVRDFDDCEWVKRHFAKYEDGVVYAWKDSRTSWTAFNDKDVIRWNYAKLAESEEE